MDNHLYVLFCETWHLDLPCGNFENFCGASSCIVQEISSYISNVKMLKKGLLRSVSIWLGSLPAITAFVEATAGIILFTTPKIQIQ